MSKDRAVTGLGPQRSWRTLLALDLLRALARLSLHQRVLPAFALPITVSPTSSMNDVFILPSKLHARGNKREGLLDVVVNTNM